MSVVYLRNRITGIVHAVDDEALTGADTEDVEGKVTGRKKLLPYLLSQQVMNTVTEELEPKFERVEAP
jgi:hypothetical protein